MQSEQNKYTTYRNFRSKEKLEDGNWIFDSKGAVTACCEVDTEQRCVKVGFSFLNPTDNQFLVRGRGLAKRKLMKQPIVLENVESAENGKLKVTESVLEYLKTKATDDMMSLTTALGIKPYRGHPEKCEFLKWFPRLIQAL
jgi:hypothetical protein